MKQEVLQLKNLLDRIQKMYSLLVENNKHKKAKNVNKMLLQQ